MKRIAAVLALSITVLLGMPGGPAARADEPEPTESVVSTAPTTEPSESATPTESVVPTESATPTESVPNESATATESVVPTESGTPTASAVPSGPAPSASATGSPTPTAADPSTPPGATPAVPSTGDPALAAALADPGRTEITFDETCTVATITASDWPEEVTVVQWGLYTGPDDLDGVWGDLVLVDGAGSVQVTAEDEPWDVGGHFAVSLSGQTIDGGAAACGRDLPTVSVTASAGSCHAGYTGVSVQIGYRGGSDSFFYLTVEDDTGEIWIEIEDGTDVDAEGSVTVPVVIPAGSWSLIAYDENSDAFAVRTIQLPGCTADAVDVEWTCDGLTVTNLTDWHLGLQVIDVDFTGAERWIDPKASTTFTGLTPPAILSVWEGIEGWNLQTLRNLRPRCATTNPIVDPPTSTPSEQTGAPGVPTSRPPTAGGLADTGDTDGAAALALGLSALLGGGLLIRRGRRH